MTSTLDHPDLAGDFKAGTSIRDLARNRGCAQKEIFERLVAAGVVQWPRPPARRAHRLTAAERKAVAAAYRSGLPMEDITTRFDVSQAAVRRVASAAGLPRRRAGRPAG